MKSELCIICLVSSLVLSQLYCILFTNFRFFGLRKLHKRLNRFDDASERLAATSKRSKHSSKSSKRSSKSDELTESLLYDEELGNDEQSDDSDW